MIAPMRSRRRTRRPGVVLVAILVSIVVILMLITSMTKAMTSGHRQARVAEQNQQAFWLAESAVQRSLHALKDSPDYQGEIWEVPVESLGVDGGATVTIDVQAVDDSPAAKRIRIEARYPQDVVRSVLHVREFVVQMPLPPSNSSPNGAPEGIPD